MTPGDESTGHELPAAEISADELPADEVHADAVHPDAVHGVEAHADEMHGVGVHADEMHGVGVPADDVHGAEVGVQVVDEVHADEIPAGGTPEEGPAPDRLLDDEAGPLVRPYMVTGGRLQPVRGKFDLISLVVATRPLPTGEIGLGPEHLAIVELCQELQSVAEIAGNLDLPAGTVRVLLGDLLDRGFIKVEEPHPETNMSDTRMYQAVIDGLRAL